jgi:hypothetical protein
MARPLQLMTLASVHNRLKKGTEIAASGVAQPLNEPVYVMIAVAILPASDLSFAWSIRSITLASRLNYHRIATDVEARG